MSDEYQPNEVVEPEAEVKQPEPKQEAPVAADPAPATVDASDEGVTEAVSSPSVVSLADLGSSNNGSEKNGPAFMASVAGFLRSYGWIAAIVVVVLLVAILFLPPVSLASRIGSGGFTALSVDEPTVSHPDGLTVTRTGEENGKIRVKLGSVPREDFTVDKLDETLASAVSAIPASLEMKGPYFTIETKSDEGVPGQLDVVIPLNSEPWETLGLYGWDGSQWVWIPSTLDSANEKLVASTDALPGSVTVMQTTTDGRYVAAFVEQLPAEGVSPDLDEVDVAGFLVGTVGGVTGDPTQLPIATAAGQSAILPVVRNWVPGRDSNWDLVHDMLTKNGNYPNHLENLTQIALVGGYPGLVVDYRSAAVADKEVYAQFITDLAAKFHENGLKLAVVVDAPSPTLGSWDTGGYDWKALGAAVDELRLVMPSDPEAYRAGGSVDNMLQWATTQVERRKLMPMYATLSTDGTNFVSMDDVYTTIGKVNATETISESVEPGTSLGFALSPAVQITADAELGATGIGVNDKTYWLGTGQWLRARMDIATRYRLGGVVLWTLYDEGNDEAILSAVNGFVNDAMTVPDPMPAVTWRITDPAGNTTDLNSQLSDPQLSWTAPEITGTYSINALVAGLDKGSLTVTVMPAALVVTDTLEGDDGDAATGANVDLEAPAGDTLAASFVADVTIPDNTRFEKGEAFTKTWRMRNSGTTDWPEGTKMVFYDDTSLSEVTEVVVGAVKVGEDVDISVDMTAPDEDGTYKSWWKLNTGTQDIPGGASYVLIQIGEQVTAPPTVAAPATGGGAFELGGHIQNGSYPYATQMHYSGMTWSKEQIRWGQTATGMINNAHANGFKLQLSALGSASQVTDPSFAGQYASWVAGMAAAGADAIEIWNEPNLSREWQAGQISPQAYTDFLCTSYNAIKAANPNTAVISAAPAPTGFFGGCGVNGCDDQPWMEGLWNAGAANCMDYLGAHFNSGATSPSATIGHPADPSSTHHSWFYLPQTQLYWNIFQGTRQIFYTEMGYVTPDGTCGNGLPSTFAWGNGTTVANQSAWLAEAVQLSMNTGYVKAVIIWNIDFQQNDCGDCDTNTTFCDPQRSYGIIRPGGGCPACDALHNLLGTR